MDEVDGADLVVERVAALDLGKAGLEACVRVPHPQRPGRRMQELRGYGTTTAQLWAMAAWLRHWHVQRVVMESTSTYWKGVYYLLEAEGFDCWLVNAREVKNVPGRACRVRTPWHERLPPTASRRCRGTMRGPGPQLMQLGRVGHRRRGLVTSPVRCREILRNRYFQDELRALQISSISGHHDRLVGNPRTIRRITAFRSELGGRSV